MKNKKINLLLAALIIFTNVSNGLYGMKKITDEKTATEAMEDTKTNLQEENKNITILEGTLKDLVEKKEIPKNFDKIANAAKKALKTVNAANNTIKPIPNTIKESTTITSLINDVRTAQSDVIKKILNIIDTIKTIAKNIDKKIEPKTGPEIKQLLDQKELERLLAVINAAKSLAKTTESSINTLDDINDKIINFKDRNRAGEYRDDIETLLYKTIPNKYRDEVLKAITISIKIMNDYNNSIKKLMLQAERVEQQAKEKINTIKQTIETLQKAIITENMQTLATIMSQTAGILNTADDSRNFAYNVYNNLNEKIRSIENRIQSNTVLAKNAGDVELYKEQDQLEKASAKLQEELEYINEEYKKLKLIIDNLDAEIDVLTKTVAIQNASNALQQIENLITDVTNTKEEVQNEINNTNKINENLKIAINEKSIQTIQSIMNTAKSNIQTARKSYTTLNNAITALNETSDQRDEIIQQAHYAKQGKIKEEKESIQKIINALKEKTDTINELSQLASTMGTNVDKAITTLTETNQKAAAIIQEAKAKQEAEVKAIQEAEVKAIQEAEIKAKQEAEVKAKQEAEVKAKQEAEAKAIQEAEAKAIQEAEIKAKQEAEAKREKKKKSIKPTKKSSAIPEEEASKKEKILQTIIMTTENTNRMIEKIKQTIFSENKKIAGKIKDLRTTFNNVKNNQNKQNIDLLTTTISKINDSIQHFESVANKRNTVLDEITDAALNINLLLTLQAKDIKAHQAAKTAETTQAEALAQSEIIDTLYESLETHVTSIKELVKEIEKWITKKLPSAQLLNLVQQEIGEINTIKQAIMQQLKKDKALINTLSTELINQYLSIIEQ